MVADKIASGLKLCHSQLEVTNENIRTIISHISLEHTTNLSLNLHLKHTEIQGTKYQSRIYQVSSHMRARVEFRRQNMVEQKILTSTIEYV